MRSITLAISARHCRFHLLPCRSLYAVALIVGACTVVDAATKTWVGELAAEGDTSANASIATNWSPEGVPVAQDDILLDGSSTVNLCWDGATADMPALVNSWTQTADYTGTVIIETSPTSAFNALSIAGNASLLGGKWTHPANVGNSQQSWLKVLIGGDLQIGAGAKIDLSGKGFSTYTNTKGTYLAGPGAGTTANGARHGGQGGFGTSSAMSTDSCYGSYSNPTTLGSSANKNGAVSVGGGAVILEIGGALALDGDILATTTGATVGASGGSVNITAARISGSGRILADGGSSSSANKGGGGGGRVALCFTDAAFDRTAFAAEETGWGGTITARGGGNTNSKNSTGCGGAAGTVYIEFEGDDGHGTLRIDNNANHGKGVNGATMFSSGTVCNLAELCLVSQGCLALSSEDEVIVETFANITSEGSGNAIRFLNGGKLLSARKDDILHIAGYAVEVYGQNSFAYTLRLGDGGSLHVDSLSSISGVLTVDNLRIGRTTLPAGQYSVEALSGEYSEITGSGTINVLGRQSCTFITIK